MPVSVTGILREAIARSVARNGLVLMGVLFVLSAINGLVGAGAAQEARVSSGAGPLVSVPGVLAALFSLLTGLATLLVTLAAIRIFVSDETRRVPREALTRNGLRAVLNYVVGSIVFGIVVLLGLVALVIPGLFLLVTLAFWAVSVAVEDENFLAGFRRSWALTGGHRLRVFGLGLVVVLSTTVVSVVLSLGGLFGGTLGSILLAVGSAAGGTITTVFTFAVLAVAYNRLVALDEGNGTQSTDEHSSSSEGTATT